MRLPMARRIDMCMHRYVATMPESKGSKHPSIALSDMAHPTISTSPTLVLHCMSPLYRSVFNISQVVVAQKRRSHLFSPTDSLPSESRLRHNPADSSSLLPTYHEALFMFPQFPVLASGTSATRNSFDSRCCVRSLVYLLIRCMNRLRCLPTAGAQL